MACVWFDIFLSLYYLLQLLFYMMSRAVTYPRYVHCVAVFFYFMSTETFFLPQCHQLLSALILYAWNSTTQSVFLWAVGLITCILTPIQLSMAPQRARLVPGLWLSFCIICCYAGFSKALRPHYRIHSHNDLVCNNISLGNLLSCLLMGVEHGLLAIGAGCVYLQPALQPQPVWSYLVIQHVTSGTAGSTVSCMGHSTE